MKKLIMMFPLLFILAGCAGVNHKPGLGSYADAATTYAIVESSSFTEANPLLSVNDPFVAAALSIGLKHGMKYTLTPYVGEEVANTSIETAGITASGWNIALLLGASNPVGIGVAIVSGWLYWEYSKD